MLATQPATTASAPSKDERKLQKKLREIEALERRLAQGEALEANQLAKVASKAAVRSELAAR